MDCVLPLLMHEGSAAELELRGEAGRTVLHQRAPCFSRERFTRFRLARCTSKWQVIRPKLPITPFLDRDALFRLPGYTGPRVAGERPNS
jgi:hypothetical protein